MSCLFGLRWKKSYSWGRALIGNFGLVFGRYPYGYVRAVGVGCCVFFTCNSSGVVYNIVVDEEHKSINSLWVVFNISGGGVQTSSIDRYTSIYLLLVFVNSSIFIYLQYRKMTKKTTLSNSVEMATVNFETSNFKFEIDWDYLDVYYDCKSLDTWFQSRKIKSYWILDEEKARFWIRQINKLYQDTPKSSTVWVALKELMTSQVITSPLWK